MEKKHNKDNAEKSALDFLLLIIYRLSLTLNVVPPDKSIVQVPYDPNKQTKENIYEYLEEGMFKKDAAEYAGISESTFYDWQNKDPSFRSQVERSILKYKRKLIKIVTTGSIDKPQIALKILEKRWGKEWNPPRQIEIVDPDKQLSNTLSKLLIGSPTKDELMSDSDEPATTNTTRELPSVDTGETP